MKADLDRLMEEREIDAFIIFGDEGEDPYRGYLMNGAHASATVVKKANEAPILIVNGMEVDEAKKSGLEVKTYVDFNFVEIIRQYRGDTQAIQRELWKEIVEKLDIKGRVAFYGYADVMNTWRRLNEFQENFKNRIEIVIDKDPTIFALARRTKDEDELVKLRDAGERTSRVLQATRNWLASHRAEGETVVNAEGQPLTIGDVKRFVRLQLMENGLEDAEGMIFAQGRDAGVPHSRGEDADTLKTGQAIVFDLFPRLIDNGYYHDSTRTWCLGYAPDEVKEAFDLVLHAHMQSLEAISIGQPTRDLQELVCDVFEAQGHPTPRSKPGTQEGYVHSLGHGLGLNVHEGPTMRNGSPAELVFEAGNVVTIEPGLYYPEKGWGIRVEDTVYLKPDGHIENMTDCPYDLVIPLQD